MSYELDTGELVDEEQIRMSKGNQITIPQRMRNDEDGYIVQKRNADGHEYYVLIPMLFQPTYPEATGGD